MFRILSNLLLLKYAHSFIWTLNEVLHPNKIITYSEQYMFASHEGPILFPQSESSISSTFIVNAL